MFALLLTSCAARTDSPFTAPADTAVEELDAGSGHLVLVHGQGETPNSGRWPRVPSGQVFAVGMFPSRDVAIVDPADCLPGLLACVLQWPAVDAWVWGDDADYERQPYAVLAETSGLDVGETVHFGTAVLTNTDPMRVDGDLWATEGPVAVWEPGTAVGLHLEGGAFGSYDGEADLALPTPLVQVVPELDVSPETVFPIRWEPADDGQIFLQVVWAVAPERTADFIWGMTALADDGAFDLDLSQVDLRARAAESGATTAAIQLTLFRQTDATLTLAGRPIHLSARSEQSLYFPLTLEAP